MDGIKLNPKESMESDRVQFNAMRSKEIMMQSKRIKWVEFKI